MLAITEDDVRRLLPMGEAVRLLKQAFLDLREGRAGNQVRRRMFPPNGTVLHAMAGWQGKYLGTKIYTTNHRHGAWFQLNLYELNTGRPLANFEANYLGQIRTGAASGLATDLLANPNARTLAIIGSGFQARTQLEAVRTVRPSIEDVRVWSPTPTRREAFAKETGSRACATAEEAIRGADVICTATFAREPVLERSWVSPGAHINAAGSNNPQRREIPADVIEHAGLLVADSAEACLVEAGDLLLAKIDWKKVIDLKDVRPGWEPGRISVFKSVGLGLEDVAVAASVYEKITLERASNDPNPARR